MIVYLDANVLMQDPICAGAVWQVLAHAPDSWGLRLVTSEIAIAEAVAGYGRQLVEAMSTLERVTKPWQRLGVSEDVEALREALRGRSDRYRDHLLGSLRSAGVDVVPPPAIPHMEVVARSVARRPPCDANGNGYRDTLHWLTVLQLTKDNDGEQVTLVTSDPDFMDVEKTGFHPELVQELEAISVASRVRLVSVLADVTLELAERSADDEGGVKALRAELKDETVRSYVVSLAEGQVGTSLDERTCALPRVATANLVQQIGPICELKYVIKGRTAEDEAIAAFSFKAETQILVTLPAGVSLDVDVQTARVAEAANEDLYIVTKPMVYSGIVHLGRYDRPLGGEVSRIAATHDDPARKEWTYDVQSVKINPLADMMKGVRINPLGDMMKDVRINPLGDMMKGVRINPLGEMMKGYTSPLADLMKAVRINPLGDMMKGYTSPLADMMKNFNPVAGPAREEAPDDERQEGALGAESDHERGDPDDSGETGPP